LPDDLPWLIACGGGAGFSHMIIKFPVLDKLTPVLLPEGNEMYFERDLRAPMRDTLTLSANIFRLLEAGELPVIMAVTPYN